MRVTGLWCCLCPTLIYAAAPVVHLLALNALKSLDGTEGTTPLVGYQVAVTSELDWTSEMHVCMWHNMNDNSKSAAVCSEQPSGTFPFDSPCGDYVINVAIVRKGSLSISEQSLMSAVAELPLSIDCTSKNLARNKAVDLRQRLGTNISSLTDDVLWQPFHADIWHLLLDPEVEASQLRKVSRIQHYLEPCNSDLCADRLQHLQRHARWSQVCSPDKACSAQTLRSSLTHLLSFIRCTAL
jgi:hypothetical protein